ESPPSPQSPPSSVLRSQKIGATLPPFPELTTPKLRHAGRKLPMKPGSDPTPAIRRRDFIRLTGMVGVGALAAAGSSAATPQPTAVPKQAPAPTSAAAPTQAAAPAQKAPAQASGAMAEWDKVVEGAQKEGRVSVTTLTGDGYRKVLDK